MFIFCLLQLMFFLLNYINDFIHNFTVLLLMVFMLVCREQIKIKYTKTGS